MKDRKPFGYPPPAIRRDKDFATRRPARVPPVPSREHRSEPSGMPGSLDDLLNSLLEKSSSRSAPLDSPSSTDIPPLPPPARRREFGTRERLLEAQRTWRTTDSQGTAKADNAIVNVPMKCASKDRPFVLRFRKTGGLLGKAYRHEATITGLDSLGDNAPSLSVPTNQMLWSDINCPHCRALCRPIHCGSCQKLVCDGRSSEKWGKLHFRCSESCGASGPCSDGLTSVRGNAASSAPAQRLLGPPAAAAQTLPKTTT
jgi:hypothetical protein